MTRQMRTYVRRLVLASAAALFAIACGGDSEEAAFREASEDLAEAQAEAEVARGLVQTRIEALDAAQAELEEAEAALRDADDRVDEARQALAEFATDDVVFRAVQLALLETPELGDVAIRANVDSGVVSLWGSVASEAIRDRAIAVAKAIPGVVGVQSHIGVEDGAVEPAPADAEESEEEGAEAPSDGAV